HLDKVCLLHEEFASLGKMLSQDDLVAIILSSLPSSYNPCISAILAPAHMSGQSLTSDQVMQNLAIEYDC
ncbi:hypothetical protein J3R82DRAFT_6480, partial [Butyriboletus roseoflavus]